MPYDFSLTFVNESLPKYSTMKNYTESFGEVHNEIIGQIKYGSEQPLFLDFDMMSANLWQNDEMSISGKDNEEEGHVPDYDNMVADLLQNEADNGIYPQVGKYSKIFSHVDNSHQ